MGEVLDRIAFVEERDGEGAGFKWAEQTLAVYTGEAATKGRFHEQVEDLITYFKERGYRVQWVAIHKEGT